MTDTTAIETSAGTRLPRWLGVITACVAALIVWAIIDPVAGHQLTVGRSGHTTEINGVAVAIASLVVGLAGWGLLAILERTVKHPGRVWTITAIVVLVLSLVLGPLGGSTNADRLGLACLHLVVAAVLIGWLGRKAQARRTA